MDLNFIIAALFSIGFAYIVAFSYFSLDNRDYRRPSWFFGRYIVLGLFFIIATVYQPEEPISGGGKSIVFRAITEHYEFAILGLLIAIAEHIYIENFAERFPVFKSRDESPPRARQDKPLK